MSFADYLYFLLPSAFKRTIKRLNHFWILCKVLARHIGEVKSKILDVREQSMILTCQPELLPVFGEDYNMPRLKGESTEAYRSRLTMKADIAKMAGTKRGILLMLASLGYERSYIEPFYKLDPDRWSEFLIFLAGDDPSVTDMRVVDNEVMAVKQATSMPAYAREAGGSLLIQSSEVADDVFLPFCNTIYCGVWPDYAAAGIQQLSYLCYMDNTQSADFDYPLTNQVISSETYYQSIDNAGAASQSVIGFYKEETGGLIQ